MPKARRCLVVEQLEDRCVPALFGLPWPDAGHLTLSLVPDGTAVDNSTSSLFSLLAAQGIGADAARREILRAFQTWAVNANINLSLTGDGGQPVGGPGALQGDPRFGDVRIAAHPLTTQVAISSPFDLVVGTRGGDVVLNANDGFGLGNPEAYDLYSVVLHEAGHSFGLGDNNDPTSVEYQYYSGAWSALSAGDVTALHALYGTRTPDAYEGAAGNDTLATATNLDLAGGNSASTPLTADADVTTQQDADVYQFTAPTGADEFTVRVRTDQISLLEPRLTVYDASGDVVASTVSTSPLTGSIAIQVPGAVPGATYYAKVQSGSQDVFGIGAYRLEVLFGPQNDPGLPPITPPVQTDGHTNDTAATATVLPANAYPGSTRFDYTVRAALEDAGDVDFYRVSAPAEETGQSVMLVELWGLEPNGLSPRATVYDASGDPVSAAVVVNDHGSYVLQVTGAQPGAAYDVAVAAAPGAANNVGSYFLDVDFRTAGVNPDTFVSEQLGAGAAQSFHTLQTAQSSVFHLILGADTGGSTLPTAVRMTIYDSNYNAVFTLVAVAGSPVSANVYLAAGRYYFRFVAATQTGDPLPLTGILLRGIRATDAQDPMPISDDGTPVLNPPPPPTPYTWQTDPSSVYDPISSIDPYSNPWVPI